MVSRIDTQVARPESVLFELSPEDMRLPTICSETLRVEPQARFLMLVVLYLSMVRLVTIFYLIFFKAWFFWLALAVVEPNL